MVSLLACSVDGAPLICPCTYACPSARSSRLAFNETRVRFAFLCFERVCLFFRILVQK